MATFLTVDLCQGDLVSPEFQISKAGEPLNLDGFTVTADIKPSTSFDDGSPGTHQLEVGSGLVIIDAATGKVSIDVPGAVTDKPGGWFFKIRVSSNDKPVTAIFGWFKIADT